MLTRDLLYRISECKFTAMRLQLISQATTAKGRNVFCHVAAQFNEPDRVHLARWMNSRPSVLFAIVALLAVAGCRRSVQSSSAMAPTIKAGERVTVDFRAYAVSGPRRWDVVALEPPGPTNMVLKRVIGLPGERISLTASGIVVNGSILNMPVALSNVAYCSPESLLGSQSGGLAAFPYAVPPKHYFVVGDNWTNSYDSRHYGAISLTNILGRVKNK